MNIKLKNLTKKFISLRGGVAAIKDINLTINDKEFFVLLGPSGCGKSTLLNLIAGLEKPSSGEIFFGAKVVASFEKKLFLTPKERNIAMVFQNYALYPHLSVYENIAFPLRIQKLGSAEIKDAVENAAAMLNIADLFQAKPAELSGGQKQRVAIARAVVRKPDIFLMDEPLSNLDAQLRTSTRTELKLLQKKLGITTIYVTHDQTEAITLGDRVAVLKSGKIEQIGTPDELYNSPANTFIATFVGNPPMNLIKTKLITDNGKYFLAFSDNRIELPKKLLETGNLLETADITIGLRPEHIEINRSNNDNNSLKATILDVESLGRENIVNFSLGGSILTALTNKKHFLEKEEVSVSFDINNLSLFKAP
ncbi:MAG: hypothetical protein A2252_03760 [Elusimicrobia bacterium RIFOXYA2_FULL_39_19]|nr:MAG: hypothetical protein A2252_03760 [Elusimicrobia bacterium RIFOXYA2_FULL_39_19]